MFVLFIVLNAIDRLEDILKDFVYEGISGATIIDSQGMGKVIAGGNSDNIPLFGTLRLLLQDSHPYSKTIFTVLENEEMVNKAVKIVQQSVSECPAEGTGFMFTVPIGKVYKMCDGSEL